MMIRNTRQKGKNKKGYDARYCPSWNSGWASVIQSRVKNKQENIRNNEYNRSRKDGNKWNVY